MHIVSVKFNKKTAVTFVILAALFLIGVVLMVSTFTGMSRAQSSINVKSESDRISYLEKQGWQVKSPAISEETVIIPRTFSEVYESYNDLQIAQGFDLSQYCGNEVQLYIYEVLNYAESDYVVAHMYVYHGTVIGGDVHSTALDGFMVGLKRQK